MYAQLLMAASFAIAAYQDVRERAVSDLVWVPALAGAVYGVYSLYVTASTPSLEFFLLKVVLLGGIALVFVFIGSIGQADGIAIAFFAVDPYILSPIAPLLAAATVGMVHVGYEIAAGNARGSRTVTMEQFLREQRWIPKAILSDGTRTEVNRDVNVAREEVEATNKQGAMVEVRYGVPTVAYFGIGYVVYLVYLVAFNLPAFSSLP